MDKFGHYDSTIRNYENSCAINVGLVFSKREGIRSTLDYLVAGLILALPVFLIARQPDLGTALLVLAAGLYVIILAGLPWRWIVPIITAGGIAILMLIVFSSSICAPDVSWPLIREYQKNRVCTLLDPSNDPLGRGFHTIQAMIGWLWRIFW